MSSVRLSVYNRSQEFATFPAMPGAEIEGTSLEAVASRLKLTREALYGTERGSQARLCRATGIKTQSWNNAETGDNRIGIDDAIKLCQVTGVTLDWIYQGLRVNLPQKVLEYITADRKGSKRRRA